MSLVAYFITLHYVYFVWSVVPFFSESILSGLFVNRCVFETRFLVYLKLCCSVTDLCSQFGIIVNKLDKEHISGIVVEFCCVVFQELAADSWCRGSRQVVCC